ncbi:17417_t:CDS:1, partial [Racocetra fulgida]
QKDFSPRNPSAVLQIAYIHNCAKLCNLHIDNGNIVNMQCSDGFVPFGGHLEIPNGKKRNL